MIKSRFWVNYFVIILILLSGNVFFSLRYPKESRLLLIISVIVLLVCKIFSRDIKFNYRNLFKLLSFIGLLALNFLINSSNGVIFNRLLMLLVIILCVFILSEYIDRNMFILSYVNIMKYFCLLSLVVYFTSKFMPIEVFPFFREELLGTDIFKYSFYHSWGWGIGTTRNSGMFWEPGAFQCFINISLIFELFDDRKNKFNIIIFIITILTTQSTSGYIIMAMVLLYSMLTLKIKLKSKINVILVFIFIMIGLFYLFNSEIITDKFDMGNTSYKLRTNDLRGNINIITKYPLKGVGYVSELRSFEENNNYIDKNSNGLLIFIMEFGLIIFVIYTIFLYDGIKKIIIYDSKFDIIFFILMLFLMFNSEAIVLYPLFLYFIF